MSGRILGAVKYFLIKNDFHDPCPGPWRIVGFESPLGQLGHRHKRDRTVLALGNLFRLGIAPPAQTDDGAGIGDKINAPFTHGSRSKASAMSFSNLSQSAAVISFSA